MQRFPCQDRKTRVRLALYSGSPAETRRQELSGWLNTAFLLPRQELGWLHTAAPLSRQEDRSYQVGCIQRLPCQDRKTGVIRLAAYSGSPSKTGRHELSGWLHTAAPLSRQEDRSYQVGCIQRLPCQDRKTGVIRLAAYSGSPVKTGRQELSGWLHTAAPLSRQEDRSYQVGCIQRLSFQDRKT